MELEAGLSPTAGMVCLGCLEGHHYHCCPLLLLDVSLCVRSELSLRDSFTYPRFKALGSSI